jgi:hypothetical protein
MVERGSRKQEMKSGRARRLESELEIVGVLYGRPIEEVFRTFKS